MFIQEKGFYYLQLLNNQDINKAVSFILIGIVAFLFGEKEKKVWKIVCKKLRQKENFSFCLSLFYCFFNIERILISLYFNFQDCFQDIYLRFSSPVVNREAKYLG